MKSLKKQGQSKNWFRERRNKIGRKKLKSSRFKQNFFWKTKQNFIKNYNSNKNRNKWNSNKFKKK